MTQILDRSGKPADLKEFIGVWNDLASGRRLPQNEVELAFYAAISVVQHMSMSNPLFVCVALWYFTRLFDSMAPEVFGETAIGILGETTEGMRTVLMPILYNFWAAGKEGVTDDYVEDGGRSEAGDSGLQAAEQGPPEGEPRLDGTFVGSSEIVKKGPEGSIQ